MSRRCALRIPHSPQVCLTMESRAPTGMGGAVSAEVCLTLDSKGGGGSSCALFPQVCSSCGGSTPVAAVLHQECPTVESNLKRLCHIEEELKLCSSCAISASGVPHLGYGSAL